MAQLPFEIERGFTETLPWGAVRVAGRNRPDTRSNPYYRDVTIKLLSPADIATWIAFYNDTLQEGSLPFEIGEESVAIVGEPAYSTNTGIFAAVSMRLEYDAPTNYCQIIQEANPT